MKLLRVVLMSTPAAVTRYATEVAHARAWVKKHHDVERSPEAPADDHAEEVPERGAVPR